MVKEMIVYEPNLQVSDFVFDGKIQYTYNPFFSKDHDINGEWTQSGGCSKLTNNCETYTGTWNVYLCSGCDVECPLNEKGKPKFCKCSCPIYPIEPGTKPYEPYC